jgi:endonuclease YncB( thermonuclease family)
MILTATGLALINKRATMRYDRAVERGERFAERIQARATSTSTASTQPSPEQLANLPAYWIPRVFDGNTVEGIDTHGVRIRIRLLCSDAPERDSQPFGDRASAVLSDLVGGKIVRVAAQSTDQNSHTLAQLYFDEENTSASLSMIAMGLAWGRDSSSCDTDYQEAEAAARARRAGLWAEDDAVPPWEWRRRG